MPDEAGIITYDEFLKLQMRVAKIVEAAEHPNADKLLVLQVDLGDEKRQIVAGIKGHYDPADLPGRNIIIVTNLAPRKMRGYESQGMLLAASTPDQKQIVLLTMGEDIAPGCGVN